MFVFSNTFKIVLNYVLFWIILLCPGVLDKSCALPFVFLKWFDFIYWYSYVESAFLVFFVCFLRASCFPFAST